jgi:hypothetical protein
LHDDVEVVGEVGQVGCRGHGQVEVDEEEEAEGTDCRAVDVGVESRDRVVQGQRMPGERLHTRAPAEDRRVQVTNRRGRAQRTPAQSGLTQPIAGQYAQTKEVFETGREAGVATEEVRREVATAADKVETATEVAGEETAVVDAAAEAETSAALELAKSHRAVKPG